VWAALTEPRRLAVWQHPVEYLPELRTGATIYAHLNYEVDAIALGKILRVDPPSVFAFRWTTNNPMLPPEFTLEYRLRDGALHIRYGPFGPEHGIIGLLVSLHIHLDHLDEAIITPADQLPDEPWPRASVVTRSGRMRQMYEKYAADIRPAHPELLQRQYSSSHMRR
jgi:uncharacterized protein YndB with AHSA1/START domain